MSDLLERVTSHLEELDYAVEARGEGIFEAQREGRWNFVFTEDVGGVLFRSAIPTRDSASDLELYDLMNDVHSDAVVIRMYLDDEGDLALEAWWPPTFEAEAFEMFVRAWNHDISQIAGHPEVEQLLS